MCVYNVCVDSGVHAIQVFFMATVSLSLIVCCDSLCIYGCVCVNREQRLQVGHTHTASL